MSNKVFENSLTQLSQTNRKKRADAFKPKVSSETLLVARNLVAPHYTEQAVRTTKKGLPIPEDADIGQMLKVAANAEMDARNILKSSPELCMGIDIYIAGLLSPNDVSRPELNITSNLSGEIEGIKSKMLDVIREWAKNEYKIDGRLKKWVFRSKYLSGALPIAIIPLTQIDNIINEKDDTKKKLKLESYDSADNNKAVFSKGFYRSTGLLGKGLSESNKKTEIGNSQTVFQSLKMESSYDQLNDSSINIDAERKKIISDAFGELKEKDKVIDQTVTALSNVFIHDNPEVFKIPRIAQAVARKVITNKFSPLMNLAQESADADIVQKNGKTIELTEGGELLYPDRQFSTNEILSISPTDIYDNVGHPIILELPYGSTFPVAPPGLPENHIGYIVALDSSGNPLSIDDDSVQSPDPSDIAMQTSSGVMGTQILSQVADASVDGITNLRYGALNKASNRIFNSFLIADIKERLKNGLYKGVELDVRFTNVFLEQMWKRAMVGQQVQFLFLPTELLTYIAFEYNELGMGESKLIKHKDIAIIASTVQVANALASINNAITHKKVTIGFDEDEIDAFDTDEKLKQYIVRAQWANTLFTSSNTQDQLNHILNSAYHFVYENGNGAFPNTTYDIEYLNREAAIIENDYLDKVNNRLIMLSGVSPEIVDMSQEVEFAQTYITGHMLRAQQASLEQDILCSYTTKFIQGFTLHSEILLKQLLEIVKQYREVDKSPIKNSKVKDHVFVQDFIASLETSLPKPDTSKINMQKENLETHEALIDKCIEYYFSDPVFESSEIGEKLGDKLELFKNIWKSSYMRGIMQTNNLIPPQFQMLHGKMDEDNYVDPFVEGETIVSNMVKLALQHESQISKLRVKSDTTFENIQKKAEGGNPDGQSDNELNDTSSTSTNNDDNDNPNPESTDKQAGDPDDGEDLFNDGNVDNPLGE